MGHSQGRKGPVSGARAMNRVRRRALIAGPALQLFDDSAVEPSTEKLGNSAVWRINGYPAEVSIWTSEEFARANESSMDVVVMPNGLHVRLRVL